MPMAHVITLKRKKQEEQRRGCDNRSRSQNDAIMAQKTEEGHERKNTGDLWKLEKVKDGFPLEPSRRNTALPTP